jgi:hypothetical protein
MTLTSNKIHLLTKYSWRQSLGSQAISHEVTGRVNKCSRMGILFYIPTINIQQRFSPPQRVEKL